MNNIVDYTNVMNRCQNPCVLYPVIRNDFRNVFHGNFLQFIIPSSFDI